MDVNLHEGPGLVCVSLGPRVLFISLCQVTAGTGGMVAWACLSPFSAFTRSTKHTETDRHNYTDLKCITIQ